MLWVSECVVLLVCVLVIPVFLDVVSVDPCESVWLPPTESDLVFPKESDSVEPDACPRLEFSPYDLLTLFPMLCEKLLPKFAEVPLELDAPLDTLELKDWFVLELSDLPRESPLDALADVPELMPRDEPSLTPLFRPTELPVLRPLAIAMEEPTLSPLATPWE